MLILPLFPLCNVGADSLLGVIVAVCSLCAGYPSAHMRVGWIPISF